MSRSVAWTFKDSGRMDWRVSATEKGRSCEDADGFFRTFWSVTAATVEYERPAMRFEFEFEGQCDCLPTERDLAQALGSLALTWSLDFVQEARPA